MLTLSSPPTQQKNASPSHFDPSDLPAFKTSPYSPGRDDTVLGALTYCASSLTGKEIKPLFLSSPELCFRISVQYWCTENQDFGISYSDTSVYSSILKSIVIQRVFKSSLRISVSWPAMFPFLERCKGQRRKFQWHPTLVTHLMPSRALRLQNGDFFLSMKRLWGSCKFLGCHWKYI